MNKKPEKEEIEVEVKKSDAKEVKEILEVVSKEVPALIKNIFSSLYSADIAIEYGKGIALLFKELKEQGLPEDMIRDIVMKYANSINLIGNAINIDTDKMKKKHTEEKN